MTALNYRTDYLHQSPERVAKDFLVANNLYKAARNGNAGIVRIGSKIFGEQYILASIYSMLIKGYTDYDTATKTGLGGTKICDYVGDVKRFPTRVQELVGQIVSVVLYEVFDFRYQARILNGKGA